jgi:hypothetical protein
VFFIIRNKYKKIMASIDYNTESIELIESSIDSSLLSDTDMYSVHHDSELITYLVGELVKTEKPFIDKISNPDIVDAGSEFTVYKLSGTHPLSAVGRSIEGTVIEAEWRQDQIETASEASIYEHNSLFFLVIDTTDPDIPKPAASLRVADCLEGPSETVQFFKSLKGEDVDLPEELIVSELDQIEGLWDVVGVMAVKNYRGGNATAWAYHALYKASQDDSVHRWISNITDKEFRNLNSLGIPFKLIDGTEKVELPRGGKSPLVFGFYNIDVDEIRMNMTSVIEELESAEEHKEFYKLLAKLSRIAMDGKFTFEEVTA